MGKKPLQFGDFLQKKGVLKKSDKLTAWYFQKQTNKQVGLLAIKQQILNAQKVQNILQQQKSSRKKNNEISVYEMTGTRLK